MPHLIRALKSDRWPSVRYRAAEALGKIGDAAALESLAAGLKDDSNTVRCAAARALGELRQPAAYLALSEASRGADYGVRVLQLRRSERSVTRWL